MNIHFHTLVLDGVFTTAGPEGVRFYPTPPPTDAEVARLLSELRGPPAVDRTIVDPRTIRALLLSLGVRAEVAERAPPVFGTPA